MLAIPVATFNSGSCGTGILQLSRQSRIVAGKMTSEDKKSTVRQFLSQVFSAPQGLDQICTQDFPLHWRGGDAANSCDQMHRFDSAPPVQGQWTP